MVPTFHYDSRDFKQPFTRNRRFLFFLFVLCTVVFALNLVLALGYDWSGGEEGRPAGWQIAVLVVAGGLCLWMLSVLLSRSSRVGYADHQYLAVEEDGIRWRFLSREGERFVAFTDVQSARQDSRHLILKKTDGEEVWIENYTLIDQDKQWPAFIEAVRRRLPDLV